MFKSDRCFVYVRHWDRTYNMNKLGDVLSLKKSDPGQNVCLCVCVCVCDCVCGGVCVYVCVSVYLTLSLLCCVVPPEVLPPRHSHHAREAAGHLHRVNAQEGLRNGGLTLMTCYVC